MYKFKPNYQNCLFATVEAPDLASAKETLKHIIKQNSAEDAVSGVCFDLDDVQRGMMKQASALFRDSDDDYAYLPTVFSDTVYIIDKKGVRLFLKIEPEDVDKTSNWSVDSPFIFQMPSSVLHVSVDAESEEEAKRKLNERVNVVSFGTGKLCFYKSGEVYIHVAVPEAEVNNGKWEKD